MEQMQTAAGEIEQVRQTLTPNVIRVMKQSTNTLSQIGIENLEKLDQNRVEFNGLLKEVREAQRFLNQTMDKVKYTSGPGLSWDDPVEVTDGRMKTYDYNVEEVARKITHFKNQLISNEESQNKVGEITRLFNSLSAAKKVKTDSIRWSFST